MAFLGDIKKIVEGNDQARFKVAQAEHEALATSNKPLHDARDKLMVAAAGLMAAKKPNAVLDALNLFVDMNDATWRARHVLYLEDNLLQARLAQERHPQATAGQRTAVETFIASREQSRLETLGARELGVRRSRLVDLLANASLAVDPTGKNAAAYATTRAELDVVDERIEALRTKVIAAAKAPAPKPAKGYTNERAAQLTRAQVEETKKSDWDKKITLTPGGVREAAPKIVFVLEALP